MSPSRRFGIRFRGPSRRRTEFSQRIDLERFLVVPQHVLLLRWELAKLVGIELRIERLIALFELGFVVLGIRKLDAFFLE